MNNHVESQLTAKIMGRLLQMRVEDFAGMKMPDSMADVAGEILAEKTRRVGRRGAKKVKKKPSSIPQQ